MKIFLSQVEKKNEKEIVEKMNSCLKQLFKKDSLQDETFVCSNIFSDYLTQFSGFFILTHLQEDDWKHIRKLATFDSAEGICFHEISPKSCRDCVYVSCKIEFGELLKDKELELYWIGSSGGMDYLIFSESAKWAMYSSKENVRIIAFTEELRPVMASLYSPYIQSLGKITDHLSSIGDPIPNDLLRRYETGYFNPEPELE